MTKKTTTKKKVDKALADIECENPALAGALSSNYYSTLGINPADFASLLDTINGIESHIAVYKDFIGRVYEYCLGKFALQEDKGKGEYYTSKNTVNLITEEAEARRDVENVFKSLSYEI